MDDHLASRIKVELAGKGMGLRLIEENIKAAAHDNRYHPVKEYFSDLQYDGQNHMAELASYISDEKSVFPWLLQRFLVGVVARIFERTQNFMLILEGKQGIGKSRLVEWLGQPFFPYSKTGPIIPDNKDHSIARGEVVIWEVSEVGVTTRKADREALKAFITDQHIRERRPYGKHAVPLHPVVSFIGTYNDEGGFLTDPTGNRRFNPVSLLSIDWQYSNKINVDQIWAQAYSLYQAGENWHLTVSEELQMSQIRRGYEVQDSLADTILMLYDFDSADKDSHVFWYDIREGVKSTNYKYSTEKALTREISAACTKIGALKIRKVKPDGGPTTAYLGLKLKSALLKSDTAQNGPTATFQKSCNLPTVSGSEDDQSSENEVPRG